MYMKVIPVSKPESSLLFHIFLSEQPKMVFVLTALAKLKYLY